MPQSWLAEAGATAGILKLALEVGADVFLKVQSQDHRGLRSSRLGVQGRTALHSPVGVGKGKRLPRSARPGHSPEE